MSNLKCRFGAISFRDLRHMANLKCRLGAIRFRDLRHMSNLKCRFGPQIFAISNRCQNKKSRFRPRKSRSQTHVKLEAQIRATRSQTHINLESQIWAISFGNLTHAIRARFWRSIRPQVLAISSTCLNIKCRFGPQGRTWSNLIRATGVRDLKHN